MGYNLFYRWWWKFEMEFADQLHLSTLCSVSHLILSQIMMYLLYVILGTTQTQLHWILTVVCVFFFQLYRPDWVHLGVVKKKNSCLITGDWRHHHATPDLEVGCINITYCMLHANKEYSGLLHYLDSSIGELLSSAVQHQQPLPIRTDCK